MKKLRTLIIISFVSLAVFFNIERLDFAKENAINIDTFVYVLALIALISIIGIRSFQRWNIYTLLAVWAAIYFLSKIFFFALFNGSPIVGGVYTYLSITELVLLLLMVGLAYKMTAPLKEFEDTVEKITFATPQNRIRQFDEASEEIQVEMFRSRHHHHPLSIVVVEPDPESLQISLHQAIQEVQCTMMNSYVINSMAQNLSKYVRRTDMILEQRDKERFVIVCPETNSADLQLMVEYIQTVAAEQLGVSVSCGMATFPSDALTFEDLMHQAALRFQQFNVNGHNSSNKISQISES